MRTLWGFIVADRRYLPEFWNTSLLGDVVSPLIDDLPSVWIPSRLMLDWRPDAVSFIGTREPSWLFVLVSPTGGGSSFGCHVERSYGFHVAVAFSAPVLVSSCRHVVGDSSWLMFINMQILFRRISRSDSLLKMKSIIHRSHVDYVILN